MGYTNARVTAEDRANIAFARFLSEQQARVRPRLTQSEWAREAGVTVAYLNRLLRYPELLASANPNRIMRPRARVAIAILKVLEHYLREPGLTERGLRTLGYDPATHTGRDDLTEDERDLREQTEGLVYRILALPESSRRHIERVIELEEERVSQDSE